jgi:predicted metal-dependent hydrolase
MTIEKIIEDKELGTIRLIWGTRYKRYAIVVVEGIIRATMPPDGDEKEMMSFIGECREKLLRMLKENPTIRPLDENTVLQTATFQLKIIRTERKNFQVSLNGGVLTVECPAHIPIEDKRIQQKLHEILRNTFRSEAKRVLPARVEFLAGLYKFTCTGVKISCSRRSWGSCTPHKSLNLSLYLMQLSWHLIDYVILHELCHTREMNHSVRFWALMDWVTVYQTRRLREELKQQRIIIEK